MTVKLLCDYGKYSAGNLITLTAAEELALVALKMADTNTAGGTAYVPPAPGQRGTARARTAVQLSGAPTASDISMDGEFYLNTDPTQRYVINAALTAYSPVGGGAGGVAFARTTAQLAGVPSAADIALGAAAMFYDPTQTVDGTHPWVYYSATSTAYVKINSGSTGASSFAALTGDPGDNTKLAALLAQTIQQPVLWDAVNNVPPIASGTAPSGFNTVVVSNAGIVNLGQGLDSYTQAREKDQFVFDKSHNVWQRYAGPGIDLAITADTVLTDVYSDCLLTLAAPKTITLNKAATGGPSQAGFVCKIRGAFVLAGDVTAKNDLRFSDGTAVTRCTISRYAADSYDLDGNK